MLKDRVELTQELFFFEINYLLRQPGYWVVTLSFSIWAMLFVSHPYFNTGIALNTINAPITIVLGLSTLTAALPLFVITFVVGSVIRDKELHIDQLFFVLPIKGFDYLMGRFLAGLLCITLIFVCAAIGIFSSQFMPWVDESLIGKNILFPYLFAFGFIVLPNILFVCSALLFVASLTRSLSYTFLGIVSFYFLHSLTGLVISHRQLSYLLDPFGVKIFFNFHFTNFSNSQLGIMMPVLSEDLVLNRLLWIAVSTVLLVITLCTFKMRTDRVKETNKPKGNSPKTCYSLSLAPLNYQPNFDLVSTITQWSTIVRFDYSSIIRSIPFKAILVIALIVLGSSIFEIKEWTEARNYLIASSMLENFSGMFNQLLLLIMIFCAGELVFSEKQTGLSSLTDVLPVSNAVWFASKATTLFGLLVTYQLIGVLLLILLQSVIGTQTELLVFINGAAIESVRPLLFGLTALSIQVLLNNKNLSFFVMVLILAQVSEFIIGTNLA